MTVQRTRIKQLSFFEDLPDAIANEVGMLCAEREFSKGKIIYLRGEVVGRVFLILSGEVELYLASAGQRIVVQVLKAGDFFGDLGFLNHPLPFSADEYTQAASDARLCIMNTIDVTRLLEQHTPLAMAFLTYLRSQLHQAQSKIRDLAISTAPTRLLNELIRHAAYHGERKNGFYEIEEKLTHQTLANMSGLARETVTKTLGQLEKHGFISYTPERQLRLDIKKIAEECIECLTLIQKEDDT